MVKPRYVNTYTTSRSMVIDCNDSRNSVTLTQHIGFLQAEIWAKFLKNYP